MIVYRTLRAGALVLSVLLPAGLLGGQTASSSAPGDANAPTPARQAAAECANRIVQSYLHDQWDDLTKELSASGKHVSNMTRDERQDVNYVRQAHKDYRPGWWKSCRSSSNVSFQASIWGRNFTANFMPSDLLGGTAPVDIRDGKLIMIVTWKPSLVDSPQPAEGWLCKRHGLSKGNLAEAIVWHELGHNYVSSFLPLNAMIELYSDHWLLFEHLQEFYAEMTALHHTSPMARRAVLLFRLDELENYDEGLAHDRMSHAIGAMILAEVLSDPQDWPSFHLPPQVPDKDIERQTLIYLYEDLDPNVTLAEDRALRDMSLKFIRTHGDSVLKSKGQVPLASKLTFNLVVGDDRQAQVKRNAWVKQKLEAAIQSGRADKPLTEEQKRKQRLERAGPRVVVPW